VPYPSTLVLGAIQAINTYIDDSSYANVRTNFSRSHWRVFAAAINASLSLASMTPTSFPIFAVFKSARPPLSTAIALRGPKASRTKSIAALSIDSAFAPSSERMTATASNSTEGVPASCPSAALKLFQAVSRN